MDAVLKGSDVVRADVRAEVGTQSENVLVAGVDAGIIEKEQPVIAGTLNNRQLIDLPRDSRDINEFLYLNPDITQGPNGDGSFKFIGGQSYGASFSLDSQRTNGGIFGEDNDGNVQSQPGNTSADGVAPRFILSYKIADTTRINAQVSKGFRLGGINDPLNLGLCSDQDKITFGGHPNWNDETVWNYELGAKSKFLGGKASVDVSVFYMDIHDLQANVTAGSCSSRLVFNVPKARSVGVDLQFEVAPTRNFDFAFSGSYDNAKSQSTVTAPAENGTVSVLSGIRSGARLPSVPFFKWAAAATFQFEVRAGYQAYVTAVNQFVGSRYTQFGDDELGTLPIPAFGTPNTPGSPYTESEFRYDPKLPAYDIVNARIGVKQQKWDLSLYGNNLTDERAFLALDRERGTRARIGYLTNQPRTFGTTLRVNF